MGQLDTLSSFPEYKEDPIAAKVSQARQELAEKGQDGPDLPPDIRTQILQNETGALQRLSTPCTSAANGGDRSGAQLDECVGGGVWRMGGLARRGESLLGACRWLIWRM